MAESEGVHSESTTDRLPAATEPPLSPKVLNWLAQEFVDYWNKHYPSDASARQSAKKAGFNSVEEAQSHVRKIFLAGAAAGVREIIAGVLNDLAIIESESRLPDGDGVNVPTALWAKDALSRIRQRIGSDR